MGKEVSYVALMTSCTVITTGRVGESCSHFCSQPLRFICEMDLETEAKSTNLWSAQFPSPGLRFCSEFQVDAHVKKDTRDDLFVFQQSPWRMSLHHGALSLVHVNLTPETARCCTLPLEHFCSRFLRLFHLLSSGVSIFVASFSTLLLGSTSPSTLPFNLRRRRPVFPIGTTKPIIRRSSWRLPQVRG